jgi:prepilin-type N-terminal cleavage/methylation domain-containing protein
LRRSQRGFTLVEMMIVVAIIAVLGAIMVGLSGRTYGVNAKSFADQVNSTVTFARTRAVAMRKYHEVEIALSPANYGGFCRGPCVIVWAWSQYGMAAPDPANCVAPANHCWQLVSTVVLPQGITVWNAQTSLDTAMGQNPTQNPALDFRIDYRPDGSSTGGTIFVTDSDVKNKYRVLIYPVTGSSYARQYW